MTSANATHTFAVGRIAARLTVQNVNTMQ